VSARLIVSVSGLGSCPPDVPARLAAELDRREVPLSLVVTPSRLAAAPAMTEWVRKRVDGGDALLLRGFDHLAGHLNPARWPKRTAVLPAHETRLQLIAARTALNQLHLTTDGYAPRGWLVPPGTLDVLRRNGFRVCAELRGVRDLQSGELVPGRVLGPGTTPWQGEHTEPWWCRATVPRRGPSRPPRPPDPRRRAGLRPDPPRHSSGDPGRRRHSAAPRRPPHHVSGPDHATGPTQPALGHPANPPVGHRRPLNRVLLAVSGSSPAPPPPRPRSYRPFAPGPAPVAARSPAPRRRFGQCRMRRPAASDGVASWAAMPTWVGGSHIGSDFGPAQ